VQLASPAGQHSELGGFSTQLPSVFTQIYPLDAISGAIELEDARQILFSARFARQFAPPAGNEPRAFVKRSEDRLVFFGSQQIAEEGFESAILFEEVCVFYTLKVSQLPQTVHLFFFRGARVFFAAAFRLAASMEALAHTFNSSVSSSTSAGTA
jgi:hypothetical protein